MLEGSRAFDIAWGTATGILCLALALPILMAWVWRPEWSLFGMAVDPKRRLQIGWGLVAIGMGFTNFACRYIPHNYLLGVHEGFALITLVITLVLAPRVVPLVVAEFRRGRQATTA
jgi:hypothetical protein